MKTENLNYTLPSELIAQHPAATRSDSRLLVVNRKTGEATDSLFAKIGDFMSPGDCLILNNTKVVPARFFGRRATGAKIEGLFLAESAGGVWSVMLKGTRKLKPGETFYLKGRDGADFCQAELLEKLGKGRCLLETGADAGAETILEEIGFPPLPPYIKRDDDPAAAAEDSLRYQTVYAQINGAVAAPTAGLHFTDDLMAKLRRDGIDFV